MWRWAIGRSPYAFWLLLLLLTVFTLACRWLLRREVSGEPSPRAPLPTHTPVETASPLPLQPQDAPTGLARPPQSPLMGLLVDNTRLRQQPPQEHQTQPGEPPPPAATLWDRPTGQDLQPGRPVVPQGGDTYTRNIYERPFNEVAQDTYFPDLDIVEGRLSMDGSWVYVSIVLYGLHPEVGFPQGSYGVELDLDRDGRGDVLVWVEGGVQSTAWADTRVAVYLDADGDVGAARACLPDAPFNGSGYERLVYYEARGEDPDLAWVRWVAGERPMVQLAFKRTLLRGSTQFTWWVWADGKLNQATLMDFHDSILFPDAGSPYPDHPLFPVRDIARVDNTCHGAFGFEPTEEDLACNVCPPEGEFPPDEPFKMCPAPEGPPMEECTWDEARGVWVCPQPSILYEEGSPSKGSFLAKLARPLRALTGGRFAESTPPPPVPLDPSDSVLCRWNPYACSWDCDNQCPSNFETLPDLCYPLEEAVSLPEYLCGVGGDPPDVPRWEIWSWSDTQCRWEQRCFMQPSLIWDKSDTCEIIVGGIGPIPADFLRGELAAIGLSDLVPPEALVASILVCGRDLDGDGRVIPEDAETLFEVSPGDELEVCVEALCSLNCQTITAPPEDQGQCPGGPDIASLEESCTWVNGPFVTDAGTFAQCYIDDGDGRMTETLPDGTVTIDTDDTNLIYRWNEKTCSWDLEECLYGPQCPSQCPMPPEGPDFCDYRVPLEDGRWLCTWFDITSAVIPPQICAWNDQTCSWECEETQCPMPEEGPDEATKEAIFGRSDWECIPKPDEEGVWVCYLPDTDAPPYLCTWSEQLCGWSCEIGVCQPPASPQEEGYCEERDDGTWVCPGRGTFDQCEWDTEECRWRCWNICEVDTNGPDGCDQVIPLGGNTWACITGTKNLTCTFNTDPNVCGWECDLRCEIPSDPPPACTYKYRELEPGYWECYDPNNNVTRWRYDLTQCQWVKE